MTIQFANFLPAHLPLDAWKDHPMMLKLDADIEFRRVEGMGRGRETAALAFGGRYAGYGSTEQEALAALVRLLEGIPGVRSVRADENQETT
jgi:hypothetical protein